MTVTSHTITWDRTDPAGGDRNINVDVTYNYFPPERGMLAAVALLSFHQVDGQGDVGRDEVEDWLLGDGFGPACDRAARELHKDE